MVTGTQEKRMQEGRKRIEIDQIPSDWEVKKLGELIDYKNGKSYESRITQNGNYFLITLNSLNIEGRLKDEHLTVNFNDGSLNKNDLIMILSDVAHGNFLGLTNLIPDDNKYVLNQRVGALKNIKRVTPYYLSKYINLNQKYFKTIGQGSSQQNISKGDILNFKVAFPISSAEQMSIDAAVSDIETLISTLERLIAKKCAIKQGAMQELLTGKRRFPGFAGGWKIKRLSECLIRRPEYGINAPATDYSDNLPRYIRITDITEDGHYTVDKAVSVNHPQAGNYYLDRGDIVLARTGASVGKSYLYRPKDGKLVFAGFLIRVKPDESQLLSGYLAGYLQTYAYWNWVTLNSMRSGQPGINGNQYGKLQLPVPTIEEQTAIVSILSKMDDEIEVLQQKLAKNKRLKQGMMQVLLTGKIRLKTH